MQLDSEGLPGFEVRTKVMIPSKKAKVLVMFGFNPDTFSHWPLSIGSLTSTVNVSYGDIE